MARLGRKALQQIEHEHSRRGTPEPVHVQARVSGAVTDSSVQAVDNDNAPMISGSVGAESSQKVVGVDSAMAPVVSGTGSEAGMGNSMMEVDHSNGLDSGMHGFADIDTLFGEFLDLSLPTNFWDPIFLEDDMMEG
jgi:hypothetical protein